MEPYYAQITGNNVRLRSGPGTNYKKAMEENMAKGTEVKVMAHSTDTWDFVQVVENGVQGYVYSQYVSEPIVKELPADEPTLVEEYIMIAKDDLVALNDLCKKLSDLLSGIIKLEEGVD